MPPDELLLIRRHRASLICRNLAVAGHSHSTMPGVEIDSWLALLRILDAEIERRHLADGLWG